MERLHMMLHERHELLERKDEDGQTPLHLAAFMNDDQAVRMLLHHRANIHATDDNGQGVLHMTAVVAAGDGHLGLLRFFLSLGLDAAAPDDDGTTPREAISFLPEDEGFNITPVARLLRRFGG